MSDGPKREPAGVDAERLKAERDELQRRVEQLEGTKRSRTRTIVAAVLVVLSILSLAAVVPGTWTRRTLRDTDRYVETVSEVAAQPEVQAYLATEITDSAFEALDVQGRLGGVLGDIQPQLAFLAAPITQGVRDVVQDKVEELLASDRFQYLWADLNRITHERIVAVLRGESDLLQIQGGKVVINTVPIVNEALKGLGGLVSDIAGRQVTLPEITPESLREQDGAAAAVSKLESALGVQLPDDFAVIEVYDADEIEAVQQVVYTFNRGVVALVVLWVLTLIGALAISQRRRRTLLQLMVGFIVVVVIERRFAIAAVDQIVDSLGPDSQAAGRAAADVVLSSLLAYTKWLLLAGVMIVVAALLSGPYGWAVRLRRGAVDVAGLGAGLVRGTEAGSSARWIAEHRDIVMAGAAAVFVVVLLAFDLNLAWFLVLIVLLALVELAAWRTSEALSSDGG
jgi:hypothetical protein